jgi:NADH-quinone oxidoreductase subunit N
MGYALIGLAAGTAQGVQAMLVYMAVYVTMNIGVFAFILSMEKDGQAVTEITAMNMYAKRAPTTALAMLVLLFSLAGVPPFLGFFAKLGVWSAALDAGLVWLVFASAIASAIGAYYYLRIVFLMYFGSDANEALNGGRSPRLRGVLMASAMAMALGIINLFGLEAPAALAAATLVN